MNPVRSLARDRVASPTKILGWLKHSQETTSRDLGGATSNGMKIIRSKWFSVVVVLVVGWLGLSFIKIKTHENIVNKEVGDLEKKIEGFENNNNKLQRLIEQMAHSAFLEREAKSKLNYKALGEEVVFVYPDESTKAGSGSHDFDKQLGRMPNYAKWWYYLMGY